MYLKLNDIYNQLKCMEQTKEVSSARHLIGDIMITHYNLKLLEKECWNKTLELEKSVQNLKQKIRELDHSINILTKEQQTD